MGEDIDVRNEGTQLDLRDRLRFAAVSLAADFAGTLTADHAEALVFSSAEGLLATASVTEFVPVLAERRARLAVRCGSTTDAHSGGPVPPDDTPTSERAVAAAGSAEDSGSPPPPLFAVEADQLARFRDRVDLVRVRVADWRVALERR